jgi:hypothetical protein
MRRLQHHRTRCPCLLHLQPPRRAHAPTVSRLQSRKPILRHRRRQIVPQRLRRRQKSLIHNAADRMQTQVFRARIAAAVAVKTRHRLAPTRRQRLTQDVPAPLLAAKLSLNSQHPSVPHTPPKRKPPQPFPIPIRLSHRLATQDSGARQARRLIPCRRWTIVIARDRPVLQRRPSPDLLHSIG